MQIYYEKPNVVVGWDEEVGCSYIKWKGFAYGEDFKTALNKVVQILSEKQGTKHLTNLEKSRVVSQDGREWIGRDWLPRARAAGLKHTAFVLPKSELAQTSLNRTLEGAPNRSSDAYFDNEEAAREWLKSL